LCNSCRKDSLKNHYEKYVGTWDWTYTGGGESGAGDGTPASHGYTLKLELLEKGKYRLYKNNHRIDHGRLLDQGRIHLISDDIYKKDLNLDGYEISDEAITVIDLEPSGWADCFYYSFSKR
jgi:hypothetical protein